MGRGIGKLPGPVSGTRGDTTGGIDKDSAHRHLSAGGGGARLGECGFHVASEGHAPHCPAIIASASPADALWAIHDPAQPIRRAHRQGHRPLGPRQPPRGRAPDRGRPGGRERRVIDRAALNVTSADRISVDGRDLAAPEPPRLWLYHKPTGRVTTARDEQGRTTIFEDLPAEMPRVMPVGRLDLNSEGLLLLTNDGGLKRRLELPSTGWLRNTGSASGAARPMTRSNRCAQA